MKKLLAISFIALFIFSKTNGQTSTSQLKKLVKANDLKSISRLITNGLDINATYKGQSTLLHFASEYGKYDIAKYLVEKGVHLNSQDKDRRTPLMISTSVFHLNDSISILLIENDANPNIVGYAGSTALRSTIGIGGAGQQPEVFKLLIEKGADINYQCNECCNRTVFLYCCSWGTTEMLQQLLDRQVEVNQTDCKGLNGLMYAIERKNTDVIKLLLKTDIELKHKDNKGKTVLDYAIDSKDEEIINLIKNKTI